MDQATCATFAGIGAAAVIARSSIGSWFIRRPVNACCQTVAGKIGKQLNLIDEWCLYCTGFWVGVVFGLLEYGWLGNVVMDGLYLAGVTWIAAEATTLVEAVWFGFMERDDHARGSESDLGERQSEPPET